MTEKSQHARLLVIAETKKDAMKAAFLDVQTAMISPRETMHTPAHMRTVLETVSKFEDRVKEYISAEDAIVLVMAQTSGEKDPIPSPADLTGEKRSNVEWAELPPTTEDPVGSGLSGTEG